MKGDTTISRSVGGTIAFGILALGFGAGTLALFTNDHPIWGSLVAFMTFGLAMVAILGPKKANCPHCGKSMSADGYAERCGACGEYARAEFGRLVRLEPDFVAPEPLFGVHVDQVVARLNQGAPRWPRPGRCCMCDGAADHDERLSITLQTPGIGLQTRLTVRFEVPHCSSHKNGAAIDNLRVLFRSFGYWRDFCELNQIPPRSASSET